MATIRKSRAELVTALRELQLLAGQIDGAYANDRAPDRAEQVHRLCKRTFDVAVAALATDPPQTAVQAQGEKGKA